MKEMIITRRGILRSLASLLAAPAIVHAQNLMPINPVMDDAELFDLLKARMVDAEMVMRQAMTENLYGDLAAVTRQAFLPRLVVQRYTEPPLKSWLRDLEAERDHAV